MRARNDTPITKTEAFRKSIRRRQIDQLLSTLRHQLPEMTRQECLQTLKINFKNIQGLLQDETINLYNNHELQIMLKELRDINCSFIVADAFHIKANLQTLIQMAHQNYLHRCSEISLFEIMLNLSAETFQQQVIRDKTGNYRHLQVQQLPFSQKLCTNDGQLLQLLIKILGNFLMKDSTSKTIYYFITKIRILEALIKIVIDRKQMYQHSKIRPTFLWFSNKVIETILRFKYEEIDHDFRNFTAIIAQQVLMTFEQCQSRKNQDQVDQLLQISINDVLVYLKTIIKAESIQITQEFLEQIETYFSPLNSYYLDLIGTLTCRTIYSLSLTHTESLLHQLLSQPSHYNSPKILRCLANSLLNDSTHWRLVTKYFIQYSQKKPLQYQPLEVGNKNLEKQYESFSFLMYFLYFLNRTNTESDMAQIIGLIICKQGGLGIFEEGISDLAQSSELQAKLLSFGYQIE